MKKILINLILGIFFSIFISVYFTSCKEDTNCKVEITTKLYSDTTKFVPYALVTLEQGDIKIVGSSDAIGRFSHIFPLEAILSVTSEDTSVFPPLVGEGTVRLVPGQTVKKTIFVK